MRAGHAYANVHTTKWPGGEIRAQLNDHGESAGLGGEAGLEARDHVERERRRPCPVDDAVVEGDRDVADLADDDLAVANDGARADPVHAEDRRPRGG